jgi:GNAT superfamily N-acetyltransferase
MRNRRRVVSLARRIAARIAGRGPSQPPQLEMRWPVARGAPETQPLPSDYRLRQFSLSDRAAHAALLLRADVGECPLEYWLERILPSGFFVVEHVSTGALVATCMAAHQPRERYPQGGNLGWLATDPEHRGRGLGLAVSAAVTARLVNAGYENIYLTTDDRRLAALALYLDMGWEPVLFDSDMEERWRRVFEALGRPVL